jgi:hypothetical protein
MVGAFHDQNAAAEERLEETLCLGRLLECVRGSEDSVRQETRGLHDGKKLKHADKGRLTLSILSFP